MRKELLDVTAFDENKKLVKAVDAQKGKKYFCPLCETEFILKKSGNTGKGSRRPHFAHYAISPNCTPEGRLHFAFKMMTLEKIQYHINNRIPLFIEWFCNKCKQTEKANLISGAIGIVAEQTLKDENYQCRPDLSLVNSQKKIYAIIEIIVTHEPEPNVMSFCNNHNIAMIQIKISSEEDLENIDEKLRFPTDVSACVKPNPIRIPVRINVDASSLLQLLAPPSRNNSRRNRRF